MQWWMRMRVPELGAICSSLVMNDAQLVPYMPTMLKLRGHLPNIYPASALFPLVAQHLHSKQHLHSAHHLRSKQHVHITA